VILTPSALRGTAGEGPVTLLASKLYRESHLRRGPGVVVVHPDTGRSLGLGDGDRVGLETDAGRLEARITFDRAVPPGVAQAAVGPDPDRMGGAGPGPGQHLLELCVDAAEQTWRAAPARLRTV
jgi:anaerobic selenocysteine-containing dehydrogenase